MTVIHLLHNFQLRLALSWISLRTMSWLIQYNIGVFPLLALTFASTIFIGLFLRKPSVSGTSIENTSFTPIDTKSPRIEDDILAKTKHIEIVISTEGVNTNQ